MPGKDLFPHQVEAVDAVLRALQAPASGHLPAEGLRTQVIAATGSGKTLIAAKVAGKLAARRVLVLVPTLDLLTQTAAAWREGGRTGAMAGVCRLPAKDSDGVPCTTDPAELVAWVRGLDQVTVFATYAAVGRSILQRAHAQGLGVWDLMVADEAHQHQRGRGQAVGSRARPGQDPGGPPALHDRHHPDLGSCRGRS
ncbi:DEAD/DEAH box helicase family protein [Streptomyces klenkii]|uniref:DEAD/DEAH box helicase family protein n=1 Tax=Streptomyces klenkii TaxID=1420899 RepID=UPI0033B7232D